MPRVLEDMLASEALRRGWLDDAVPGREIGSVPAILLLSIEGDRPGRDWDLSRPRARGSGERL